MRLPPAIGPLTEAVAHQLRRPAERSPRLPELVVTGTDEVADPLTDLDLQLALAMLYELHYHGFDGVDDRWEWEPSLLEARGHLEACFESALLADLPTPRPSGDVALDLRRLVAADAGPSLSSYLLRQASRSEFRDFVQQRSVYHLREADSHTWAIPRISGPAKAALVEIQADEYGNGVASRMHAEMYAGMMRALGIDDTYGAWWSSARAETLAVVNLMSLFGLHRRHRGALLGHLAAFEMTSTTPNRRYANGLRRLGWTSREAVAFYDEHVEADAVHEQLAAVDMCGSFVVAEPGRAREVLWGAACALFLEGRFAGAMLDSWERARRDLPGTA